MNSHSESRLDSNLPVKVFDFFSGCGGASQGFRDAGMEIVFALDWDTDAKCSFQQNFPSATFIAKDIRQVKEQTINELVNHSRPNPIMFCGCAPCQPFSKQNTIRPHSSDDERFPLILEFLRFIEYCKPDVVFVENVPGIQNVCPKSEPLNKFLEGLKRAGYLEPAYASIPLKRYGIPQNRSRFLLLASRYGMVNLPITTHGPGTANPKFETVRDWIGDLPKIAAGEEHPHINDHRAAKLSSLNIKRIQATPEGGGHRNWPDHLLLSCHRKSGGYTDVYGRMSWDRPASGLTTRCISYSNGRFGHPEQDRAISVREAACLQTFPLSFSFSGNLNSKARQIGNAVPVRLAKTIGLHVRKHLTHILTC